MKNTIVKDFIMPIAVLTAICLVISGALALTNKVTKPIIDDANALRAEQARKEVLPEADSFEQLTLSGMPDTVKEAYKAANGAGYVFTVAASGYGGLFDIICSLDAEGKIVATKMMQHNETQGMGSKCAEPDYQNQYKGQDASLSGVTAISGATVTSNAYSSAITDVFAAYETVK